MAVIPRTGTTPTKRFDTGEFLYFGSGDEGSLVWDTNLTIETYSGGIILKPLTTGTWTLPTLTSGGTDDKGIIITQTLNDTGAAGGSDVYRGIKFTLTETDITGWDEVNFLDFIRGTDRVFNVSNTGKLTLDAADAGTHLTMLNTQGSGSSSWTIARDGAPNLKFSVVSSADRVLTFDNTGSADLLVNFGSGSTSQSLTKGVFITDALEVDGIGYFDSNIEVAGSNLLVAAGTRITHDLATGAIMSANTNQTVESMMIFTGATNNHIIVAEWADQAFDFEHTQQTHPTWYIHSANQSTTEWIGFWYDGNGKIGVGAGALEIDPSLICTKRLIQKQGSDVASAADITLGEGNYFDITGTTQIDTMVATNWAPGSVVHLQFDANVTVKHATAGGGAQFQLSAAGDFAATAGDTLSLVYDGTYWRELARTAI